MAKMTAAQLTESAKHWEKYADEAEAMARWERERGIDLSAPGSSPGDHKARGARLAAKSLRFEAETGEPHCMCCLKPEAECHRKMIGQKI